MTKNYSGKSYKRYRKNKFGFLFFLCLLMIMVVITFNVADIVSSLIINKGSIFYNNTYYVPSQTYYALSVASFNDKAKAINFAQDIKVKGGAGYVKESGDYYVLLSMYKSQFDAQNVKAKLESEEMKVQILNINIPKLTFKFSESEKDAYKLSNEFLSCYDFLYDLSIKYDSGTIPYKDAINEINVKVSSLSYTQDIIATSKEVLSLKEKATTLINKLKNLSIVTSEGYIFNSEIKNTYFEIVFDYIDLCKSIS